MAQCLSPTASLSVGAGKRAFQIRHRGLQKPKSIISALSEMEATDSDSQRQGVKGCNFFRATCAPMKKNNLSRSEKTGHFRGATLNTQHLRPSTAH